VGLGRAFWRFAAASGLSNVADGAFLVAVPLIALRLTREPLPISGLELAAGLPWLLFALVAGVIADRVDRRSLLIGANAARVVLLGVLVALVVLDRVQLWVLYTVALLMGVAEVLFDTTEQSLPPMLLAGRNLERANSRLQGVEVVSNYFVGPPLGGLLAAVSFTWAFGVPAVGYLLAGAVLITLPGRFRAERVGGRTTVRADIAEGVRHLRRHPLLRRMAWFGAGLMTLYAAVGAVLPVWAVAPGPMGLSARGFGLFIASTAIGAVIASVSAERLIRRLGPARAMRMAMVAVAVNYAAPLAVNPFAVAALWLGGAYFVTVWNVVMISARQRLVPAHLFGRVNSVYRLASWGALPVGALLGGVIAQVTSPRVTFVLGGVGPLLFLFATGPFTDRALSAPEPDPERDSEPDRPRR
jgi:MFS family permease